MKIVIAGDWHRNAAYAVAVVRSAAAQGIGTVLHVGDLGAFWPVFDLGAGRRIPETGQGFTGRLSEAVAEAGVDFRFIDGNHDNHDFLDGLHGGSREAVNVDGLSYQPRGSRLQLGGIAFGFLGGAGSIDRGFREAGRDWWPQEQIAVEDVDALGGGPEQRLDVLLAHEVPAGVPVRKHFELPAALEREMQTSREHLLDAVIRTGPVLTFCGHWHQRMVHDLVTGPHDDIRTRVHVLDMEHRPGNAVVLETDDLSVAPFEIRS